MSTQNFDWKEQASRGAVGLFDILAGIGVTYVPESIHFGDANKIYFGDSDDMSIEFTGSVGQILTDLVTPTDLHIDCGTDKTIVLVESVFDDVLPYSINPGTGLTAMSSGNFGSIGFKWFYWSNNTAANEEIQCFFQLPHSYKEGTNIVLHVHVVPEANGSVGNEDVELAIAYQWVNVDGTYSTTTNSTDSKEFRIGAADANKHKVWSFTALTGTSKTISSDLIVRIRRLTKTADRVNDDYTSSVYLRYVDCHFEKDTIGSRQESAK